MRKYLLIIFSVLSFSTSFATCNQAASAFRHPDAGKNNGNIQSNPSGSKMKIKIGASTFAATLSNNATATAFKALLPLTLNLRDLNSNEKYVDLPVGLPGNATNPGAIQKGDLMLYGSHTVVLFYKTFSTSYRYTKLGRINDAAALAAALGSGDVTITFELE